ncbi:GerMN domain-containing protein [Phormidium tenue FACHB-886]|nr:GerMN domain-containing protein [Phormidium tenue FACHB-886]
MQDRSTQDPTEPSARKRRSIPLGLVAGLSAVALIAGGGVAWWTWNASNSSTPVPLSSAPATSQPSVSPTAPIEKTVQIYWLNTENNQFQLVPAAVSVRAEQPAELVKAALEQLLQKPSDPALASAIPPNTKLNSVEIKSDGVHLDLSQDFTTGGGSASMTGRLGQVIFTATTLDPTVPVWIAIDGKPLETLGGEGLLIDQPMTRTNFEQNFQL